MTTHCCRDFADANDLHTDSSGHGALINLSSHSKFKMGRDLMPINYCPWCGQCKKKVNK